MSILISAHKLGKSFSTKTLFKDLTFSIESGERIGLIGPNGMGKSTLLKILAKKVPSDSGDLSYATALKIGFLEQNPEFKDDATIFEALTENVDPEDWDTQGLAHEYISRFNLEQFGESMPVRELSGGWKKRVALARELIKEPDLLLLDEPTNHLDVEGIMWLEDFLSRARFATLTVTHDRLFLQRVANQIIELDSRHPGGLLRVKGDYAKYVEVREQLISSQERREVVLKNTLRRETEWLKQGAKARTTKQQARIERAGELKDQVEDLSKRNLTKSASFEFKSSGRSPKILIEAKKISKSYGDKTIFSDLNLLLTPKSRIGLLGENGAGKSTLIRVLMGHEKPTSGEIFLSDQLKVAYFDQTREALDPELTVAKTLCPIGTSVDFCGQTVHIRSYLDRFLFTSHQADMTVGKLSGGEQSRLMVARLMLKPANVLILDEPTNDLDLVTLTVIEDCLKEFNGAVILVTHDRYFLDQVVDDLLAFPISDSQDHGLLRFADFSQWENWRVNQGKSGKSSNSSRKQKAPVEKPGRTDSHSNSAKPDSDKSSKSKKNSLSFSEKKEFSEIEGKIQKAESILEKLTDKSSLPEVMRDPSALKEIADKMSVAQENIQALYRRWEELEAKQG